MSKGLQKFIVKNSENGAALLLLKLSPYIMNFRDNFKGDLKRTFIMSHTFSSMFGFEILDGKPVIGVPEEIFSDFLNVKFPAVKIIDGKSGLYLLFNTVNQLGGRPVAIKLSISKGKQDILLFRKVVTFVEMRKDGTFKNPTILNSFNVHVHKSKLLDWE